MKNKISLLGLIFIILVLFNVLPVIAGKGQIAQSFELSHKEYPFFVLGEGSHAGPKWSAGMDYPIQKTFHGRNVVHDSPIWDITLLIGGISVSESFTVTSGCDFEINWKTMVVIHKVTETLTFSDGTIILSIVEKIDYTTMESEGTIVGFGTENYEDVKIKGITSSGVFGFDPFPILEITHIGIIMGWP